MSDLESLFASLTRAPDFDAPELRAFDATDRLLLEGAASELSPGGAEGELPHAASDIAVIGDRHGALTLGAVRLSMRGSTLPHSPAQHRTAPSARVRTFQDGLLAERALTANAERLGLLGTFEQHDLGESLLTDARLVLMQLPRSLAQLDETAQMIARYAARDVVLLAGGRDKHMSRSMNEVLGRSFAEVTAGRGRQKSRVLTARAPRPHHDLGPSRFPVWGSDPDLAFELAAFGATFGGATLDHGTRLLLQHVDSAVRRAHRIVDLGCGNGALAVAAALANPDAEVIATDQSRAAVAATQLTAERAGVAQRISVQLADATDAVPDGWADLILLNPPFHAGAAVHAGVAHRLIRSCARALAPGGELLLVFNSHLAHRPVVEAAIGPARQVARDRTYTVLSATKARVERVE